MKPLLLPLFLSLSLAGFGQDTKTDTTLQWFLPESYYARFEPTHMIVIMGDTSQLNLDFSGDSLVVSGDMKLTEAADKFIEFVGQSFRTKIDSLKDELEKCRKENEADTSAILYQSTGTWTILGSDTTRYVLPVFDPKYDTVAVWMNCADTTGGSRIAYNVSIRGWEVRKRKPYNGYLTATSTGGWTTGYDTIGYLDSFKRPLTGYLVWGTEEVEK
jgi:hypothetical protein